MGMQRIGGVGLVLGFVGFASTAGATWPSDPLCMKNYPNSRLDRAGYSTYQPPECSPEAYISGATHMEVRYDDVCNCAASGDATCKTVKVDFIYPVGLNDAKWAPAVLMHGGGGMAHSADAHGHAVAPHYEIAQSLVYAGFAVVAPVLNITSSSKPYTDATLAHAGLECLLKRTTSSECGPDKSVPCANGDILDRIAWSAASKENVVVLGHSAGAVAGLYLASYLGTAVQGVVMLDPAKQEYLEMPPMLMMANRPTHIVHLYPDYYGPLKNASNQLFRLGGTGTCNTGYCAGTSTPCSSAAACGTGGFCTQSMGCNSDADCGVGAPAGTCGGPAPTLGAWVPIGIKDYGTCDPDAGCHESHHCTAVTRWTAYDYYPDRSHATYCGSGLANCTNHARCPANTYCSPQNICSTNPDINNSGQTWKHHRSLGADYDAFGYGARSSNLYMRYAKVYAACAGGIRGGSYQTWVNGWARRLNNDGLGGEGVCSDAAGVVTALCDPFDRNDDPVGCTAAGCIWSQGYDDFKVIRVNNAETVTEYTTTQGRYYTAFEGYNSATGSFIERQERLSSTPGDVNYIGCVSGPGAMP